MIIANTENGDLDFDIKDHDLLKNGVVIFPETIEEIVIIETIKNKLLHIHNGVGECNFKTTKFSTLYLKCECGKRHKL